MDPFQVFSSFEITSSKKGCFYSLPKLQQRGFGVISRLPLSIRVILESLLRHCDEKRVTSADVKRLAAWNAQEPLEEEIPFLVARVLLQDFTGVPLLVDLAAMRSAIKRLGGNPGLIEPFVPVDLVIDHSIQVDYYGRSDARELNLAREFQRNKERYEFLKWGEEAFKTFRIIPPGIGIVHQVNLEYLAKGVLHQTTSQGEVYYPDTLVGTDSHTTMINGLGVVGWGVGGIEAESGMLAQPIYFLTPQVVGVHLTGELKPGVTATDLALHITKMLRAAHVVGKFVEFFGQGVATLSLPDRATIANMAPEYGATMGLFPVDEEAFAYLATTGRSEEECLAFKKYFQAQELFGIPQAGQIDYSMNLELDLGSIEPSVAGPKRPQDLLKLSELKERFNMLLQQSVLEGGYEVEHGSPKDQGDAPSSLISSEEEMVDSHPTEDVFPSSSAPFSPTRTPLEHGSIVLAAITSCTNTSNPSVMLAAGLLAKKALEYGLSIDPSIKTSLAPGSRVVTHYLEETGLQHYLNQLGFQTVGYGCTTCIGNSGPLDPHLEKMIHKDRLVVVAALSGNRNFEARIHPSVKANFLMSPPLVVAFALAGRININFEEEPLGFAADGKPVFLRDLWPDSSDLKNLLADALKPSLFQKNYTSLIEEHSQWSQISSPKGETYQWNRQSTYIQEPPFFENFSINPTPIQPIEGARALAILGDSITTDHISPAGSINKESPAGQYLLKEGIAPEDFNSYGSRRGNDRVMQRGTFANVRIKNLMLPGVEGGETLYQPDAQRMTIFEASRRYAQENVPLIIIAGHEYGSGSSRDWAAKGTQLLGVRALLAASYERIHRSNLIGMGVLPLQFLEGRNAQTLHLDGSEFYDLPELSEELKPRQELFMRITRKNGLMEQIAIKLRIDTPIEMEYYSHGGILPFILRQILK